jgi:hypothetical protein
MSGLRLIKRTDWDAKVSEQRDWQQVATGYRGRKGLLPIIILTRPRERK